MSSTEAQLWKFFTYDHLLSVFHLQCNNNAVETTTTTSSWRALTSDDFLMCARDRSSAHAQSNWAQKVRLLSTYSSHIQTSQGFFSKCWTTYSFHHIIKEHWPFSHLLVFWVMKDEDTISKEWIMLELDKKSALFHCLEHIWLYRSLSHD